MGQYFKFFNFKLNVVSTASVESNGDLPWRKNLDHQTSDRIEADFDEAIFKNNWRMCDVVAIGSFGDVVYLWGDQIITTTIENLKSSKEIVGALPSLKTVWPMSDED